MQNYKNKTAVNYSFKLAEQKKKRELKYETDLQPMLPLSLTIQYVVKQHSHTSSTSGQLSPAPGTALCSSKTLVRLPHASKRRQHGSALDLLAPCSSDQQAGAETL